MSIQNNQQIEEEAVKLEEVQAISLNYQLLRTLRSYDAILYSTAMLILILIVQPSMFSHNNDYSLLAAIPIVLIAFFVAILPTKIDQIKDWNNCVIKLRIFAFLSAGLSPFAMMWFRVDNSLYYFVNLILCLYAFFLLLLFISKLSVIIGSHFENESLVWESKISETIIFWGLIVILMGALVVVSFVFQDRYQLILSLDNNDGNIYYKLPFLLIVLAASLFFVSHLIRIRMVLNKILKIELNNEN